jgi:hypothetical protein
LFLTAKCVDRADPSEWSLADESFDQRVLVDILP